MEYEILTNTWPKTADEAARNFLSSLCSEDLKAFTAMDINEPSNYGEIQCLILMGRAIRNDFGLWRDNIELLEDCGKEHPDCASRVILEKAWDLAQGDK